MDTFMIDIPKTPHRLYSVIFRTSYYTLLRGYVFYISCTCVGISAVLLKDKKTAYNTV